MTGGSPTTLPQTRRLHGDGANIELRKISFVGDTRERFGEEVSRVLVATDEFNLELPLLDELPDVVVTNVDMLDLVVFVKSTAP